MKSKYEFYEIVRVGEGCRFKHLVGLLGAILGKARNKDGYWNYAVYLYDLEMSWYLREDELTTTNQFESPEKFYDGTKVKIVVDPETGEGVIANDK